MSHEGRARWLIKGAWRALSPLTVGTGEAESASPLASPDAPAIAQIDRDKDGRPLVRGCAQKGAIRAWAIPRLAKDAEEAFITLFGTLPTPDENGIQVPRGGVASFGNALAGDASSVVTNSATAVDRKTATAAAHSLRTRYEVVTGAQLSCIHVLQYATEEEAALFVTLLEAFGESGCFGGDVGTGHGRVCWEHHSVSRIDGPAWQRWWLNADTTKATKALHAVSEFEPLSDDELHALNRPAAFLTDALSEIRIDVVTRFTEPFLHADRPDKGDNEVDITARQAPGQDGFHPVLNASAVKGVLRAQAERIIGTLCDGPLTDEALALIEELFGSTRRVGSLTIGNPELLGEAQSHTQHFVAIDRFTNGARRGALYQIQSADRPRYIVTVALTLHRRRPPGRLTGHSPLEGETKEHVLSAAALGLLYLLWRDWAEGDVKVGFKTTTGHGGHRADIARDEELVSCLPPLAAHLGVQNEKEQRFVELADVAHQALLALLGIEADFASEQIQQDASASAPRSAPTSPAALPRLHEALPVSHYPYFFVPASGADASIDAKTFRTTAEGVATHDRYHHDRYTGRIIARVRVDENSGLFIGSERRDDKDTKAALNRAGIGEYVLVDQYKERLGNGRVAAIPSATLKGCLSTTYETLTGSAMRVFEHDRIVSYRQPHQKPLRAMGRLFYVEEENRYYVRVLALPGDRNNPFEVDPDERWRKWLPELGDSPSERYLARLLSLRWKTDRDAQLTDNIGYLYRNDLTKPALCASDQGSVTIPLNLLKKGPGEDAIRVELRTLWHEDRKQDLSLLQRGGKPIARPTVFPTARAGFDGKWKRCPVNRRAIDTFNALAFEIARQTKANQRPGPDQDEVLLRRPFMPIGVGQRHWRWDGRNRVWVPDLKQPEEHGVIVFFDLDDDGNEVSRFSMSAIWRVAVEKEDGSLATLANFTDSELLPMSESRAKISPAEHLFGFVESPSSNEQYTALKGRVGVSSARPLRADYVRDVRGSADAWPDALSNLGKRERLKALGAPKPSSPSFYLPPRGRTNPWPVERTAVSPETAELGGRKIVPRVQAQWDDDAKAWSWATRLPAEADKRANLKMAIERPVTGEFWFCLDLTNVSTEEIEDLAFCLRPTDGFTHQLGLGKSLGLGQVHVKPMAVMLTDRRARYVAKPSAEAPRYHMSFVSDEMRQTLDDPHHSQALQARFPLECEAVDDVPAGWLPAALEQRAYERLRLDSNRGEAVQMWLAASSAGALVAPVRWPLTTGQRIDTEDELFKWHTHNEKLDHSTRMASQLLTTPRGHAYLPLLWSVTVACLNKYPVDESLCTDLAALGIGIGPGLLTPKDLARFAEKAKSADMRAAIVTAPGHADNVRRYIKDAIDGVRGTNRKANNQRAGLRAINVISARDSLIAWLVVKVASGSQEASQSLDAFLESATSPGG